MTSICNDLLRLFEDDDHLKSKQKCFLISQDIKDGEFTIIQLIEKLKELFVHSSPSKREQGILILAEVLKNLPSDFLNDQQIKVIVSFFIEKLKDHHQVVPITLKGILIVIGFEHFPEECIVSMLNTLFHHVACQQQQQGDRYVIYEIFQLSLRKYKQVLISMKLDLVYGIISSIDGERDPRNLLFLFKWLKTFLTVIPLGHLSEEMFEVIACYFPVDFKTPPSDKGGITREDLANELCPCLCAIPEFAEYCIPLALEKLDSSLQIAKLDSLKLLREGCTTFTPSSYLTFATEIWSQIQKEVFSVADREVKTECLNTLTEVINRISQSKNGHFTSLLNDITTTLKGNTLPDSKLFEPSISILLCTAAACQDSSNYVTKEIVPLLTNTFAISQKAIILKVLVDFIKVYLRYNDKKLLMENEDLVTVPSICLKSVTGSNSTLQSTGFDCLADLAENILLDVRELLYKYLHRVIVEPAVEEVRTSMLKCFKRLAIFYPDEVDNYILYKSKLTDSLKLDLYLNSLCFIANVNYFKEIVAECLLSYVLDNEKLASIALKNMQNLLKTEGNDVKLLEIFFQKQILTRLIQHSVTLVNSNNLNIKLLLDVSSILKVLIRPQNYELQKEIISCHLSLLSSYEKRCEELYVILLDGLISAVRDGQEIDTDTLIFLTKISVLNSNGAIRDVSVQLLANVINKYPEGDCFNKNLEVVKENSMQHIHTHKLDALNVLSWVTKALVMRNHVEANSWTNMLLQCLEEDATVAHGFKIIINDSYESLSLSNYCKKTLLYQQKFFVLVTNKLNEGFVPGKMSYLFALGYLIEYVPEQALLLQFEKIFRLIIMCLEHCNDTEILCVTLQRIKHFFINKEPVLQNNVEDLLTRVLQLTVYEQSMKVRIAALQCLVQFTTLPLHKILPIKQKVLCQLGICIDDKKRLVRKEAMETRSQWFLLDAPI